MSDLYRELLLDHARHPRGFGLLADTDFHSEQTNASCGDRLDVAVRLAKDGCISAVGFTGSGCAVTMASASLLCESLPGKDTSVIPNMGLEDIELLFGAPVTPMRTRCALLALRALQHGYSVWNQH
ncbi:MAG: Iron-sulfur cluster assembly protein [Candidatus Uhrbacteria bacterium GW2011_GWD2_52_7]|uniref:Iron-sulfur cluster assembly protein n=1 Tax=Candidatus Uhrbacteria bacterium GW2011_GWD2_52_7 TaxID=1618989 RepID=A0A0G1ZNB2_9BACT|nr:MAG: Iron-sulfur cluster assembly protein [Candidatus Uhrbacteria bacterium GW2011_GWD2_52_7]